MKEEYTVGIDLGALYLKIVILDENGAIEQTIYRHHAGDPLEMLREEAQRSGLLQEGRYAVTGAGATRLEQQAEVTRLDTIRALIEGVRAEIPQARNIIDIGAGSVSLIRLDEEGEFQEFSTNSLCAAGTGSFLDEQAERLGIVYEDLESFTPVAAPPTIATRCAVFAKSDLIHRQQQGYSKPAMWSGLCRGMVSTLLSTLLKGRPLKGETVITGGVSQNTEVMRWLREAVEAPVRSFKMAPLAAAMGAALIAASEDLHGTIAWEELIESDGGAGADTGLRPPLELHKSSYPDFAVDEEYVDEEGTEVRVTHWPEASLVQGYLGIDIGSTSTKALLMNEEGSVLADVYRKTLGEPIEASFKVLRALQTLAQKKNSDLAILGVGTTGSGRKLVGTVLRADAIINEISAHVAGAMQVDPAIDTIFEIGGQDAKFMRTYKGQIRESNMNYVCAAGTGSFVEEQARKLGFRVQEVGAAVEGVTPPSTSDRCTVFMEQDVHRLLRQGSSRVEALGAVLYSVIQNYLNKVVGNRRYSQTKVFFQGATARNRGLVAAMENLLGVEVVVSPYCHVMGCYGVALLTRQQMAGKSSRFRGFSITETPVAIEESHCELCENFCTISSAHIEGEEEKPSWGYLCGRDPEEEGARQEPGFRPFRQREKIYNSTGRVPVPQEAATVGLARALTAYSFLPLWRRFFAGLGCQVKLSPKSDEAIRETANELCGADFCFPMKLAHGHVASIAKEESLDFLCLPTVIRNEHNEKTSSTEFCPYIQGNRGVMETSLELNDRRAPALLRPIVDLRLPPKLQLDELYKKVGQPLRKSRSEIKKAWMAALEAYRQAQRRCEEEGAALLARLKEEKKPALVFVGRPYNLFDENANLSLPRKIARYGYTVLPLDLVPFDPDRLGEEYYNIYWSYGQRILSALRYIRQEDHLYPVYLTNFNCGPDSFLLSYAEDIMGDKPMLILELDEHGADAGYLTRVEAFLDVVQAHHASQAPPRQPVKQISPEEFRQRTLWVPPMHPLGSPFFAAAMRGSGFKTEALPMEDREAFELGRQLTRGSECLPTSVTIGGLIKKLREIDADPSEHAFFMATATGPCRFGQYERLHRMILDRLGYEDVPIMSPSSENSYQGIGEDVRRRLWDALVAADLVLKARCKLRPYEVEAGMADRLTEEAEAEIVEAFEKNVAVEPVIRKAIERFHQAPRRKEHRPLVGVVGEIYVRCNTFSNDDVIGAIEGYGGEAWLTPLSEWFLYTFALQEWWARNGLGGLGGRMMSVLKNRVMIRSEHQWYDAAGDFLRDRQEPPVKRVLEAGERYFPVNFQGEAILTIGRAMVFLEEGADMVVNCAPFGCMPGALTTAVSQQVQEETGSPIVNMFYDGEGGINDSLEVFLANVRKKKRQQSRRASA